MIHHRPQRFEDDFFRGSYLIRSAAPGGSMVSRLCLPSDDDSTGGIESTPRNAVLRGADADSE